MQKRIVAVCAVVLLLAVVAIGTTYSQSVASKADAGDVVLLGGISGDGKTAVFAGQCTTCPEDYFHLVVFNTAAGTAEKIDDIGPNPYEASVTADGSKVYVSAFGEGGQCPCSIGVYDTAKKEKSSISLGGKSPQGLKVTRDGKEVYYADVSRGGGLRGVDTASGNDNYEFSINGYVPVLVNLSQDEKTAYLTGIVSGNATTVKVVDISGKKELATINTGLNSKGELYGADVSKDGKTMVVTDSFKSGGKAAIIDLAGGKVTSSVDVGAFPTGVQISPDGKTAYVGSLNGKNISVVDLGGGKVTATIDTGCGVMGVVLSPDGKTLYAGCMKEKQILTIKL